MTISLSDNLNSSKTSQVTGTFEFKSETSATLEGQDFGQYMSAMLQRQTETAAPVAPAALQDANSHVLDGKEIATPEMAAALVGSLAAQAWSLKSMALGPYLSVITPESTAPDPESLQAFARAQGLDETAVSWLFGGHELAIPSEQSKLEFGGSNPLTPINARLAMERVTAIHNGNMLNFSAQNAPAMREADPVAADQTQLALQSLPFYQTTFLNPNWTEEIVRPSAVALTTHTIDTVKSISPEKDTLQVPVTLPSNTLVSAATGQTNAVASFQLMNDATDLLGNAATDLKTLIDMVESPVQVSKNNVANMPQVDDNLSIQMLRMSPPAVAWMQRVVLTNALQHNANDLKETAISHTELDLGEGWGGEILEDLLGAGSSSSSTGTHSSAYANFASRWDANTHNRNNMGNANGPVTDQSDTKLRSENAQNLAEKMGQAVGQRILSEMEKGQWHLKLQLRPATLGHIEVEMRMRSGEFDAIFSAPNAVTRDLLQDGMSKLKETLSQMGMDVANIHVGGGQTGQSDGDSTPDFSSGNRAQNKSSAQENNTDNPRTPRVKDPKDGLDVLV